MKKGSRNIVALMLAVVMVLSAVPVFGLTADAKTGAPTLSKSKVTLYVGAAQKLTVKQKPAGASVTWKSADKKVATVSKKGVVKGIGRGRTRVTAKVKTPAKTYTLKATVTVKKTSVTVASQAALNKALKTSAVKKVTLKTSAKKTFTVPTGNYKAKTLVVDAANADIVNNGNFKAIIIRAIAADTWTENATGNVLTIDAAAGHIVIPADASFSEIIVTKANSNFVLDIAGNVGKVTLNAATNVTLNVAGTVDAVAVNDRATVTIAADAESVPNIPIEVGDAADGTSITSDVPVSVSTKSDTEVNLSKGAEGSTVSAENAVKSVEVTNNTDAAVSVATGGQATQDVGAGQNATIDGSGNVTNSTTGDAGGSGASGGGVLGGGSGSGGSGGGASSSGGANGGSAVSGGSDNGNSDTQNAGVKLTHYNSEQLPYGNEDISITSIEIMRFSNNEFAHNNKQRYKYTLEIHGKVSEEAFESLSSVPELTIWYMRLDETNTEYRLYPLFYDGYTRNLDVEYSLSENGNFTTKIVQYNMYSAYDVYVLYDEFSDVSVEAGDTSDLSEETDLLHYDKERLPLQLSDEITISSINIKRFADKEIAHNNKQKYRYVLEISGIVAEGANIEISEDGEKTGNGLSLRYLRSDGKASEYYWYPLFHNGHTNNLNTSCSIDESGKFTTSIDQYNIYGAYDIYMFFDIFASENDEAVDVAVTGGADLLGGTNIRHYDSERLPYEAVEGVTIQSISINRYDDEEFTHGYKQKYKYVLEIRGITTKKVTEDTVLGNNFSLYYMRSDGTASEWRWYSLFYNGTISNCSFEYTINPDGTFVTKIDQYNMYNAYDMATFWRYDIEMNQQEDLTDTNTSNNE